MKKNKKEATGFVIKFVENEMKKILPTKFETFEQASRRIVLLAREYIEQRAREMTDVDDVGNSATRAEVARQSLRIRNGIINDGFFTTGFKSWEVIEVSE